jgi:glycine/D-amino acid oxidase-like deaminating enzyme
MTRPGPRVVVAGAGAFGGWTALELARRGAAVTLIDAWGPGNARASSGGDTRLIRATYGTRHVYTAMALRALDRWREYDAAWGQRLLNETGVLWLFEAGSAAVAFARASTASLREHGATLVELPLADARRRYPQIAFDGIDSVYVEPAAGYLMARRACHHVTRRVVAEGGRYIMAAGARRFWRDTGARHRPWRATSTRLQSSTTSRFRRARIGRSFLTARNTKSDPPSLCCAKWE